MGRIILLFILAMGNLVSFCYTVQQDQIGLAFATCFGFVIAAQGTYSQIIDYNRHQRFKSIDRTINRILEQEEA